jgi:hypothetical protein
MSLTLLDTIIWWTGAATLATIAFFGVALLLIGVNVLTVAVLKHRMAKINLANTNYTHITDWVRAGKPKPPFRSTEDEL